MELRPGAILRHGIFSVMRNMYAAFVISWPWLIVFAVIYGAAFYFVLQSGFGTTPLEPQKGLGTFFLWFIIGMAVYVVGFSSIAVNWHRYILLDEVPQGAQRLRVDGHVMSYVWRLILTGLATFAVIIIPIAALMFFLAGAVFPNGFGVDPEAAAANVTLPTKILGWLVLLAMGAFGGAVLFRFALSLPAAAVGRFDIGIGESWRRTTGAFTSLLLIAGGSALLQSIAQLVLDGFAYVAAAGDSVAGFSILIALTVVVTWFFTFFGITLLTSLYGHLVEQRPL